MPLTSIRKITADDSKVYINGSSILEVSKGSEAIRDVIEAELVFLRNGIYMNDVENDFKNEILVYYDL